MIRLIMQLVQRFGMQGGMQKAMQMGIKPQQFMSTVKNVQGGAGQAAQRGGQQAIRGPQQDIAAFEQMMAKRGGVRQAPGPKMTKVERSPRVSREDWEGIYGKRYRGQRYGDVEIGQARKPAWGKELDEAITSMTRRAPKNIKRKMADVRKWMEKYGKPTRRGQRAGRNPTFEEVEASQSIY
jgi:hypothetical protein